MELVLEILDDWELDGRTRSAMPRLVDSTVGSPLMSERGPELVWFETSEWANELDKFRGRSVTGAGEFEMYETRPPEECLSSATGFGGTESRSSEMLNSANRPEAMLGSANR